MASTEPSLETRLSLLTAFAADLRALGPANFLYADGHVESKSILDTIPSDINQAGPWEWGAKMYSIPDTQVAKVELAL